MVRLSTMSFNKFGEDIKFPFYFHIKDISNTFFDEESTNILEFYDSELNEQYDKSFMRSEHIKTLKFIDLNQFTLDDIIDEYKENMKLTKNGYIFTNHDSLYSFLISELKFNEVDFVLMKQFVENEQGRLLLSFSQMLEKEIGLGKDKDDISEAYMTLQGAFELNHANTLFPENIGKSLSEYSFRELRTQRIYLARKYEIEKARYDEVMKNNKNNK